MEKRNVERMSTISDVSRALADPAMCARIDGLIEQFRTRGVRMNALNIIAALTDEGLEAQAANILADTVLARIGQRVAPLDALPPQLGRRYVAPSGQQAVSSKPTRTFR